MRKKIKDLNVENIVHYCRKTDCQKCPCHIEKPSSIFQDYVITCCPFDFIFKNISDYTLESEVEIDE